MENYVDQKNGLDSVGKSLKSTSSLWGSGYGTDQFSFGALPGGQYVSFYSSGGSTAFFWTSTEYTSTLSIMRYLSNAYDHVSRNGSLKTSRNSVRCVNDLPLSYSSSSAISSSTLSSSSIISSSSSLMVSSSSVQSSSSSVGLCAGKSLASNQFCDERDGQVYKKVVIGSQTWMAQNLNYEIPSGSLCYDNNSYNCTVYGRLYSWYTAMQGGEPSNTTPSGVQGVCPIGWHLPSNAEWIILSDYVNANNGADGVGKSLRAYSSLWPWNNGTNQFGFTALPSGFYGPFGYNGHYTYQLVDEEAFFWTSSYYSGFYVYRSIHSYDYDHLAAVNEHKPQIAYAVRCVKD
jgi:uncharacterized protein (TIGR02145 family)